MQWENLPRERGRAFVAIRKTLTHQNYGDSTRDPDKWCITELIREKHNAKFIALEILEGRNQKGTMFPDQVVKGPDGLPMTFRLKVLSRQACYSDKSGNRIFVNPAAIENVGNPGDIVVTDPNEKPKPGDVIRIKTRKRDLTDSGEEVTLKVRNMWVAYGEDEYLYASYVVGDDLCIKTVYPHVKTFLEKSGFRIAFPQFSKGHRPRRVTQWLFREEFGEPKPEPKPRRQRRGNKNENQGQNQGTGEPTRRAAPSAESERRSGEGGVAPVDGAA